MVVTNWSVDVDETVG